jgi:hypothetical protein
MAGDTASPAQAQGDKPRKRVKFTVSYAWRAHERLGQDGPFWTGLWGLLSDAAGLFLIPGIAPLMAAGARRSRPI